MQVIIIRFWLKVKPLHQNTFILRMKDSLKIIAIISFALALFGCEKDDVKKRQAEALPSFEDKWTFNDASFTYDKNDELSIRFNYYVKDSDITLKVLFRSIPAEEGVRELTYQQSGNGIAKGMSTSFLNVLVGEDALGESYIIDTTSALKSTITIDCISNNKISGEFQVSYVLSDPNFPKFAT